MSNPNRTLLVGGTLLLFLALALGPFLPLFANPRMGLSAHQVGITGGILIVLMGIAWPHAALGGMKKRLTEALLLLGPFLITLSCVGAAVFGTSRATPIAGAGFLGEPWQEIIVSIGLGLGSIGSMIAVFLLLVGFSNRRQTS
jgi:hydroxylaminobenzene mutase